MPVNGTPRESIAINDRGLAYGDGLFETIRIHRYQPVLLEAHLKRLKEGAQRLQITLDQKLLAADIAQMSTGFPEQGILKIIVTRGTGGRGYVPGKTSEPSRILSLHAMPDYTAPGPDQGIDVFVCQQRLAQQPALAGIKHLNRLEQVLASLEWPDDSFLEGLMLDMAGNVIEGTRSNVFWASSGQLMTPALTQCGVAGIMRNYLIHALGNVMETESGTLAQLCEADEVFFCNSVVGVWPVNAIRHGETLVSFPADNRHFSVLAGNAVAKLLSSVP